MPNISKFGDKSKQFPQFAVLFAATLAIVSALIPVLSKETFAVLSSCTATVSPNSVNTNTSQRFTFTMGSVASVQWIKITRPSSNFSITGGATSGWNLSDSSTNATFTLAGNGSTTLYIDATSGSSEAASANWTVQASDDPDGASPTTCTGTLATAISGIGADTTSPTFSDLAVSEITDSAAKITWTTDESSNSTVEYGTTESYGSSTSDSASTTTHTINLTSLGKNTTYHFKVKSTDSSGNTGETDDSSLVTAKDATTTGTSTTTTTTTTVTKVQKDAVAPTTTIKTDLTKPFEKAPTIEGTASDDSGIGRIEYSVDNGVNWQPVDTISQQFAKSTAFEFTPFGLDDGNYEIKVRSFDPTGNTSQSRAVTLIIDRLPPQVGNSILTSGPLIVTPKENGKTYLLANLDYKITLSSVGGTTEINLKTVGKNNSRDFTLSRNPETGLWSAILNFEAEDEYKLLTTSVDGGQNKTEREIGKIVVIPSGLLSSINNKPIQKAKITVMIFEPTQQKYVPWDASYFNQENPKETNQNGEFGFLLPSGKYYLSIKREGQSQQKSEIFELSSATFVNPQISTGSGTIIKIGPIALPIPSFLQKPLKINMALVLDATAQEINKELPIIDLGKGNETVSTLNFRGKPTIITAISNWSGFDSNQLNILNETARQNPSINFVPVLSQEKPSLAQILGKKLNLGIDIYADPDGLLTEPLGITNLPSHYFISRNGIIKKAIYGILSKEELLNNIIN